MLARTARPRMARMVRGARPSQGATRRRVVWLGLRSSTGRRVVQPEGLQRRRDAKHGLFCGAGPVPRAQQLRRRQQRRRRAALLGGRGMRLSCRLQVPPQRPRHHEARAERLRLEPGRRPMPGRRAVPGRLRREMAERRRMAKQRRRGLPERWRRAVPKRLRRQVPERRRVRRRLGLRRDVPNRGRRGRKQTKGQGGLEVGVAARRHQLLRLQPRRRADGHARVREDGEQPLELLPAQEQVEARRRASVPQHVAHRRLGQRQDLPGPRVCLQRPEANLHGEAASPRARHQVHAGGAGRLEDAHELPRPHVEEEEERGVCDFGQQGDLSLWQPEQASREALLLRDRVADEDDAVAHRAKPRGARPRHVDAAAARRLLARAASGGGLARDAEVVEEGDERAGLLVVQLQVEAVEGSVVVEHLAKRALGQLQHVRRQQPHANLQRVARDARLVAPRQRLDIVLRPARRAKHAKQQPRSHIEQEQQRLLWHDAAHDLRLGGRQPEQRARQALVLRSRVAQVDRVRRIGNQPALVGLAGCGGV
mmetsp:Transcript_27057/g.86957  ORF Transcript_27057/g.86957 Transcript_27057/m.86957 type:complete len:538 (+) Transcript_27057:2029-3642(+)